MRRATKRSIGLVIGLAVLAGCGPEKELPSDVRISTEPDLSTAVAVPEKSEPDAVAVAERALKVAADGHPERIGKSSRALCKGLMRSETGQFVSTSRLVQAVWPDRARVSYEFETGDRKQFLVGLRRPLIWALNFKTDGRAEFVPPDPTEFANVMAVDVIGQHWVPTLLPLTDPKTVVFGFKKEVPPVARGTVDTIKVSVRGCPVFTLWFDSEGGSLTGVTYTHTEGSSKILKRMDLSGHKAQDGVSLPTQMAFSRNGEIVEQWNTAEWTFPATLDETLFDRPADAKN